MPRGRLGKLERREESSALLRTRRAIRKGGGATGDDKIEGVNNKIDNIGASVVEGGPKDEVTKVLKNTSVLIATLFNIR